MVERGDVVILYFFGGVGCKSENRLVAEEDAGKKGEIR